MKKIVTSILLVIGVVSYSQESLSYLKNNMVINTAKKKANINNRSSNLTLPLVIDFSVDSFFPDTTYWQSNQVYINNDIPIFPPSIGVATFDGLNSNGLPYDNSSSDTYGPADTLTSQTINLSYSPSDSIYFSFFYQAGGLGNIPESEDSLLLEFYSPITYSWNKVWENSNINTSKFNQVLIPIIDASYLVDSFQFRFRNYATLSGNLDHWHIDYIRLSTQRHVHDTIVSDIAFTQSPPSILENYYAIPWNHFMNSSIQQPLADSLTVYWRNNDEIWKNVDYEFEVFFEGNSIYSLPLSGDNYPDYIDTSFTRVLDFSLPINTLDSALVEIKHSISTSDFDNEINNGITHLQKFYNYYSYDDETAERAYGLNVNQGKVAVKFYPLIPDTLRGARIYFNPLLNTDVVKTFKLGVWDATGLGGSPGNLIYKMDSLLYVDYYGGETPFTIFLFDTTLYINNTFYIGVEQTLDSELHIGYDLNNNNSENLYYNVNGFWEQSIYEGSLMLNPLFGSEIDLLNQKETEVEVKLYPNPSTGMIKIEGLDKPFTYMVVNSIGKKVEWGLSINKIDLSMISDGVYFVLINSSEKTFIKKVILLR